MHGNFFGYDVIIVCYFLYEYFSFIGLTQCNHRTEFSIPESRRFSITAYGSSNIILLTRTSGGYVSSFWITLRQCESPETLPQLYTTLSATLQLLITQTLLV